MFDKQLLQSVRFRLSLLHQRFEQTLARLDTKASRRTLSALAIPSSLRSSLRLKANQKTGSTAQVPLPFSLARPLPRSPLRSADGHRNRDAIVPRYLHISPSPIGNRYSVLASLVLTAQKVVDCIKKKQVKADFFCLSVIARCRRARRT